MQFAAVVRTLGVLVMAFSLTLIPPALVSLAYGDGQIGVFIGSLLLILAPGAMIWYPVRHAGAELQNHSAFVIVAFFWCGLGLIGAIPLMLGLHLGLVDAAFETISGFTTTGATVLVGLDAMPASLLYYRAQLQWLGGMGVVVLALAVLPALKVGGMQLLRAETPGAMKEDKLTPRIKQTARALWVIYIAITLGCASGFYLAGMSLLDAVAHSFTTVSTGGFSTHDDSIAYFHNPGVEIVADVFMLLGAINFGVHFSAWRERSLKHYLSDTEVRTFLVIVLVLIAVVSGVLWLSGRYASLPSSLRVGAFEVISVITSTGLGVDNFSLWPSALPVLLIFSSFIGGCAGSTAGGIKVVRVLMLVRQGIREFFILAHPRAISIVKFNGRPVSERTMAAIWSFFSLYVVTFATLMLAMMFSGVDQITAFSAIATCMNNLGPGLGDVALTFRDVGDAVKIIGALAMLLGRLEIFTLLVLLSPTFWRR